MCFTRHYDSRFLSLSEVADKVCMGKSTILKWESESKFPKAIRLSRAKRVWLKADIDSWMIEKIQLVSDGNLVS